MADTQNVVPSVEILSRSDGECTKSDSLAVVLAYAAHKKKSEKIVGNIKTIILLLDRFRHANP
jgi:hypothetical protein